MLDPNDPKHCKEVVTKESAATEAKLTDLHVALIQDELEDASRIIERLGALLDGTVNVMRGHPPANTEWSYHDVVELALLYRAVYEAALRHSHDSRMPKKLVAAVEAVRREIVRDKLPRVALPSSSFAERVERSKREEVDPKTSEAIQRGAKKYAGALKRLADK